MERSREGEKVERSREGEKERSTCDFYRAPV